MDKNLLEITGYDGEGYVPLIDYSHWRVAELRYCEELEVDKLKDMQKHDETDEVFVLLEGDFTLFLGGNGEHIGEIEAIKLEPLKLYNLRGTYHTHTPEKNSTVLIVENVDTTDDNSPKEKLTLEQKKIIEKLYKEVNS